MQYDALGNRVIHDGRIWIPDHSDPLKRPLIEATLNGTPVRYYIWGPGRLLGFIDAAGNTLTVAHSDEQGSVIALTSADGTVLHTAHYSPHGEDWGSTGTNPTPFAWLGGWGVMKLDAPAGYPFELYLTRHRLYSATHSRFLSPDPLGLAGGLNQYQYAAGNPLAFIDPTGLCPIVGKDRFQSTLSADNRRPEPSAIMYDADLDPRSRALMHANALVPEAAIGTSIGDNMTKSMVVDTFTAPAAALVGDAVAAALGRAMTKVPSQATEVLNHVQTKKSPPAGYKGGTQYANDGRMNGQVLPRNDALGNPVTYREYDVNPYQTGVNRGTERIVIGSDGKAYYTDNHYQSFTPMR
jgi:RHS repeat-associated protein